MKRKYTNVNFAIKSRKGKRPVNQDSLSCAYNFNHEFCAVVCDGIGSVAHSERASKIVADTFTECFAKTGHIENPTAWFKKTLKVAIDSLTVYSKINSEKGISTTLAVLLIVGKKFYTYNIGDTRIYAFIEDCPELTLKQFSYDHNYKNYLIASEASDEVLNAAADKWYSLTNYIDATNPKVAKFDTNSGKIEDKTYFLLCTDGLYGYVHDNDKRKIIANQYFPLALRLNSLIHKAIKNGSPDNISGILVVAK
mgnify:CR=1 FL=1